MHPQLTVEVFLPELSEPNISSVVGQWAATEIPVERWKKKKKKKTEYNIKEQGSQPFL